MLSSINQIFYNHLKMHLRIHFISWKKNNRNTKNILDISDAFELQNKNIYFAGIYTSIKQQTAMNNLVLSYNLTYIAVSSSIFSIE